MTKLTRLIYSMLMTAALSFGVIGCGAGEMWPELRKQVGAAISANGHPASETYMLSREESDALDLSIGLSRVERGAYLLAFACAAGAMVVALRVRRKAVAR